MKRTLSLMGAAFGLGLAVTSAQAAVVVTRTAPLALNVAAAPATNAVAVPPRVAPRIPPRIPVSRRGWARA